MAFPPLLRRWATFNLVGVIGIAVQLCTLTVLVHLLGVQYLAATAIAVEGAVLHNFVWHQRWTWRDRPASSPSDLAGRLLRFHLLNGAISLAGNLALMALLSGALHVPVVLANLLAVAICSLVNFAASEAAVFRSATAASVLAAILVSAQLPSAVRYALKGPARLRAPCASVASSASSVRSVTLEARLESRRSSATICR